MSPPVSPLHARHRSPLHGFYRTPLHAFGPGAVAEPQPTNWTGNVEWDFSNDFGTGVRYHMGGGPLPGVCGQLFRDNDEPDSPNTVISEVYLTLTRPPQALEPIDVWRTYIFTGDTSGAQVSLDLSGANVFTCQNGDQTEVWESASGWNNPLFPSLLKDIYILFIQGSSTGELLMFQNFSRVWGFIPNESVTVTALP